MDQHKSIVQNLYAKTEVFCWSQTTKLLYWLKTHYNFQTKEVLAKGATCTIWQVRLHAFIYTVYRKVCMSVIFDCICLWRSQFCNIPMQSNYFNSRLFISRHVQNENAQRKLIIGKSNLDVNNNNNKNNRWVAVDVCQSLIVNLKLVRSIADVQSFVWLRKDLVYSLLQIAES